jgi:predicted GIY-YIG superfamily endonuclease
MYYVYILESLSNGDYYKGSTENYLKRFEEHNRGESQYTKSMPLETNLCSGFQYKKRSLET